MEVVTVIAGSGMYRNAGMYRIPTELKPRLVVISLILIRLTDWQMLL